MNVVVTDPSGTGTFTITVGTQTAGPFLFPASVAQVQAALQLLTNVGNNVTVSGSVNSTSANYILTFSGTLANSTPNSLSVSGAGNPNPGGPIISVAPNILVTGSPGSYQIAFVGNYAGQGQTNPLLGAVGTGGATASIVDGNSQRQVNSVSNITLTDGGNVGNISESLQLTNGTGIISPFNTPLLTAPAGGGAVQRQRNQYLERRDHAQHQRHGRRGRGLGLFDPQWVRY